jgi:hypothetical protein
MIKQKGNWTTYDVGKGVRKQESQVQNWGKAQLETVYFDTLQRTQNLESAKSHPMVGMGPCAKNGPGVVS